MTYFSTIPGNSGISCQMSFSGHMQAIFAGSLNSFPPDPNNVTSQMFLTPIHCNCSTAVGIANSTVKNDGHDQWKCNTFGLLTKSTVDTFKENLACYHTKHHMVTNHHHVRSHYVYTPWSPSYLTLVIMLSALWGCIGNTMAGYMCGTVLLNVPLSTSLE